MYVCMYVYMYHTRFTRLQVQFLARWPKVAFFAAGPVFNSKQSNMLSNIIYIYIYIYIYI